MPDDSPTPDQLAALRGSQDRALEREGIPMLLALVCESGTPPVVTDPQVRATGERLAAVAGDYWQNLAATQPGDDMGIVMTVMHAVAYDEFNAGVMA